MNQDQPSQSNQPSTPEDNIFVVPKNPPPTPEEKKRAALWVTIGLIIGFAVVVAGIFFLLFLMANSAADRYRSATASHLSSVASDVKEIDIEAILNRRDTSELQKKIHTYRDERPQLGSVIFAESISVLYQSTVTMEKQVDIYYNKVVDFVDTLPDLLSFSLAIESADNSLTELLSDRPPETPSAARTVAGSIDNIANKLKTTNTPQALTALRDELAAAYQKLAEGYRDLATAYEGPEISQAQAERRIDAARREIDGLNRTDIAEEVKQYRDSLVQEAETLIRQL